MAGKGSRARPLSVSKSQFDDNWDKIFGKKEETKDIVQVEKQDGRNIFHVNVPDHFTNEQLQTMINEVKEKNGKHQ